MTAFSSVLPAPNKAPAFCVDMSTICLKLLVLFRARRVRFQIFPAFSHARPPRAVATRTNAWFGMPELMWTPPESEVPETPDEEAPVQLWSLSVGRNVPQIPTLVREQSFHTLVHHAHAYHKRFTAIQSTSCRQAQFCRTH
jgi:hypothetical protein